MINNQRTYTGSRSRASLIILIVLAFLLLIAAIVLVFSIPEATILPQSTETAATQPQLRAGFDCDAIEAQKLYPFGEGVVKLTNNRLAYLNIAGTEVFATEIDMTSPFCVQRGAWLVAADRDGTSYVCINEQGVLYTGKREGRISGIAIHPAGTVALIEDRHDSTGVISMLEPQTGKLLYECFLPESGYVLSVSFPTSSPYFDIALLNTDGSAVRPMIKRYSLAGERQGQYIPALEDIYPLIVYDQADNPVLCSSDSLAAISFETGKLLYSQPFTQIQAVAQTNDGLAVLAAERLGGKLWLYPVQKNGKPGTGLAIGDEVSNLVVRGNLVALGSGTHVMVYNAGKLAITFDQDMAVDVLRVGFVDDSNLTVVTRSGVHRLPIK
jgi:hypothetical protein